MSAAARDADCAASPPDTPALDDTERSEAVERLASQEVVRRIASTIDRVLATAPELAVTSYAHSNTGAGQAGDVRVRRRVIIVGLRGPGGGGSAAGVAATPEQKSRLLRTLEFLQEMVSAGESATQHDIFCRLAGTFRTQRELNEVLQECEYLLQCSQLAMNVLPGQGAGSRGLLFQTGEHVANERVAFGSMPIADFLAGCTSFNLTDSGLTSLQHYPTLNCLRTMGREDAEGNKTPTTRGVWESFCTKHKLPDTFKEAAAEHVVVELAVNNFFKWREVEGESILTWETLEVMDRRDAARWKPGMKKPDTLRTQRALRLLQGDIVHKEGENGGSEGLKLQEVFDDFCKKHSAWSDPSQSFVFFRDHEGVKDLSDDARAKLRVTRIQHSGLCYMHAPAVLQHNLVTLHSRGDHHEMLNVAKYIVKFFDEDMIYSHVVQNRGASSITFLRSILGLGGAGKLLREYTLSPKSASRGTQVVDDIVPDLKKYGVALVAEYQVDAVFRTETSLKGDELQGEAEGLHAMMLVGHRQDDKGQHMFLLQNWWRAKQFVEVSSDYLAAAEAKIVFVTEAVMEIPRDFPTNDNVFAMETEDIGEVPEPEMRGN